jgi:hypothetical protein
MGWETHSSRGPVAIGGTHYEARFRAAKVAFTFAENALACG